MVHSIAIRRDYKEKHSSQKFLSSCEETRLEFSLKYTDYVGGAAPIHTLCITRDIFDRGVSRSPFRNYCVVNLVDKQELFKCPDTIGDHLRFAVEYQVSYVVLQPDMNRI